MEVLDDNDTHMLIREHINIGEAKGWWFSLVERSTGLTRTIIHPRKDFLKGCNVEKIVKLMANVEPRKVYKKGK